MYCLMADGVALSDDRKSRYVRLQDEARWHGGVPITAANVLFSYDSLMSASSNAFGRAYLDSWIERNTQG
jgi:microcin C transport system substrate-binding protein